ncbi:hypothetical protein PR048_024007 [Dryococelus australis]|uniref:Uncharacterized protein n=1 Tax=Dryococelus australis TaxID=614101 RepID=A0ABQ9GVR6_9NEOP|nr:hypothetical protein PR048_024007 [Dryococelus australis]
MARAPSSGAAVAQWLENPINNSHLGEPGSIPSGVTPDFSPLGIVPDDAVGRLVFSGISRFPRPFIPALLHAPLTLKDWCWCLWHYQMDRTTPPSAYELHINTLAEGGRYRSWQSERPRAPGGGHRSARRLHAPNGAGGGNKSIASGGAEWQQLRYLRGDKKLAANEVRHLNSQNALSIERSFAQPGEITASRSLTLSLCGIETTSLSFLSYVMQTADDERRENMFSYNRGHDYSISYFVEATVAGRLACSPSTKANRVKSPARSLRIFATENRAGRCRCSGGGGGFLMDLPFPPPFHYGAAPYSHQSPSSALKTSLLRAAQISSLISTFPSPERKK